MKAADVMTPDPIVYFPGCFDHRSGVRAPARQAGCVAERRYAFRACTFVWQPAASLASRQRRGGAGVENQVTPADTRMPG